MAIKDVLVAIDTEITQLTRVKALLSDEEVAALKPSFNKKAVKQTAPGKRTMSTEARTRISAAQKKRWAAQRKTVK